MVPYEYRIVVVVATNAHVHDTAAHFPIINSSPLDSPLYYSSRRHEIDVREQQHPQPRRRSRRAIPTYSILRFRGRGGGGAEREGAGRGGVLMINACHGHSPLTSHLSSSGETERYPSFSPAGLCFTRMVPSSIDTHHGHHRCDAAPNWTLPWGHFGHPGVAKCI